MEIRDAVSTDLPLLKDVDPMAGGGGSRWQQIETWVMAGELTVALVNHHVVGYAVLNYSFFDHGFIPMLMVKEENRRKGVATAFIVRLEEICRTSKLFTSTNKSNVPMQNLMKNLSYEASGTVYNLDDGDPELFYFKRLG